MLFFGTKIYLVFCFTEGDLRLSVAELCSPKAFETQPTGAGASSTAIGGPPMADDRLQLFVGWRSVGPSVPGDRQFFFLFGLKDSPEQTASRDYHSWYQSCPASICHNQKPTPPMHMVHVSPWHLLPDTQPTHLLDFCRSVGRLYAGLSANPFSASALASSASGPTRSSRLRRDVAWQPPGLTPEPQTSPGGRQAPKKQRSAVPLVRDWTVEQVCAVVR